MISAFDITKIFQIQITVNVKNHKNTQLQFIYK